MIFLRLKQGVRIVVFQAFELIQPPGCRFTEQDDVGIVIADEVAQRFHFPIIIG